MEQLITDLGEALQNFGKGAYLVVSLVVLLETIVVIGQFVPGSVFLAFIGFLCYARVFDFTGMLLSVYASHYAGEMINYALGRKKGRSLFHEDSRFFKPRFLNMAEERFNEGGVRILVVGQFLGFLRPFLSLSAGAAHYPLVRFVPIMAFGAFLWSLLPLALGYLCGASWEQAVHYMEGLSLFLLVAIPTALLSGWIMRRVVQYSADFWVVLRVFARRLRNNPRYLRLSTRHPMVFRILERRLSLSKPWGIGATFGFAIVTVLLCVVAAILLDIRSGDNWKSVDLATLNLLEQLRTVKADYIFTIITHLGSSAVVWPVVMVASAYCFFTKQHKSLLVILGSVGMAVLLSQVLKFSYGRERPDITLRVLHASGYSFPSGHASVAFGLFGALYYWLWNHPGIFKLRATLAFFILLIAMLIGFSRLYLGVHYPSDVTAGFCIGAASVIAMVTVAKNIERLGDVSRRADVAALIVLLFQVTAAIYYADIHPTIPPREFVNNRTERELGTREKLLPAAPTAAISLSGEEVLPVNILLTGGAESLGPHLQTRGWTPVRPSDFFTRRLSRPVFPAFIKSKPPQLTFEHAAEDKQSRLVLRLWATELRLQGQFVWAGSVVTEKLRPRWKRFKTFAMQSDVDATLEEFAAGLDKMQVERIEQFRPRGLYKWKYEFFTHGWALFITAPAASNRVDTPPALSGV